jgi:uncharacterized protein (UPF0332 family)
VSPRSEEFIDQARDRLAMAREVLAAGHREGAVSAAYYSMLYAARAALSEDDENARTHRGMWNLFRIRYVTVDAFDVALFTLASTPRSPARAAITPPSPQARRRRSATSPAPPTSSPRSSRCWVRTTRPSSAGQSRRRSIRAAKVDRSARIAQLVEHFHGKEGVTSSSLVPGLASALGCIAKLRRDVFASYRPHMA